MLYLGNLHPSWQVNGHGMTVCKPCGNTLSLAYFTLDTKGVTIDRATVTFPMYANQCWYPCVVQMATLVSLTHMVPTLQSWMLVLLTLVL